MSLVKKLCKILRKKMEKCIEKSGAYAKPVKQAAQRQAARKATKCLMVQTDRQRDDVLDCSVCCTRCTLRWLQENIHKLLFEHKFVRDFVILNDTRCPRTIEQVNGGRHIGGISRYACECVFLCVHVHACWRLGVAHNDRCQLSSSNSQMQFSSEKLNCGFFM